LKNKIDAEIETILDTGYLILDARYRVPDIALFLPGETDAWFQFSGFGF